MSLAAKLHLFCCCASNCTGQKPLCWDLCCGHIDTAIACRLVLGQVQYVLDSSSPVAFSVDT
eukprot:scaffold309061_cov25-Prasinocladus_malaysianus.AAC.1